jgi:hypothetical protein
MELCSRCLKGALPTVSSTPAQLMDLADRCKKADPSAYSLTLGELFGGLPILNRTAYSHLCGCPFEGVVTTNFDPLLYHAAGNRKLVSFPDPLFLDAVSPRTVVYMHGIARRDGIADGSRLVFSKSEFDDAYRLHFLQSFMEQMLGRYNTLFVGCRLEEHYIEDAFDRLQRIYTYNLGMQQRSRKILLSEVPDPVVAASQDRRLGAIGIDVIRYPALGSSHKGLDEALEEVWNMAQKVVVDPGRALP